MTSFNLKPRSSNVVSGNLYRLVLLNSEPVIPRVCVVTGQPADLVVPIPRYTWKIIVAIPQIGIFLWTFRKDSVSLPFSKDGYAEYQALRPVFWETVNRGLEFLRHIPLLPLELVWLAFCFLLLPWLHVMDRTHGRRNLCWVSWRIGHHSDKDGKFRISVTSRAFVDEFIRLNPTAFEPTRGIKYGFRYCNACHKVVPTEWLHKKPLYVILIDIILSFITCGLWLIMFILHFCTGQWRCCRCGQTDNRKATKEEMELFNQRTKELKTLASAPRPELSPPCGVADCLVIGSVLGLIPSAKTGSDTQPTQERIPDTGGTRKCPACAEIIKTDANVCRFCGRNFSTAEVTQAQQEQARAAEVAVQQAVFAKQQERHTRRLHARRIWRLVFGIPLTCIGGFFVIAGTCMFFDSSAWQPGATTGDRVLGCLPPVVVVGLLPLAGGIALLRTAKSIKRLLLAARDAPPVASNQPTDPSKTEAVG